MAYTPTVWKCGDTITAEKLNKLEQGVANSGGGSESLVVRTTTDGSAVTLDKTWQEIYDAYPSVYILKVNQDYYTKSAISSVGISKDGYAVESENGDTVYLSKTPDGYPMIGNPK